MRGTSFRIDAAAYVRAIPLLVTHPSIVSLPLLAAVVAVLFDQIGGIVTDPLGGIGSGLLGLVVQIVFLWAFGIAIIQASNVWRGRRGSFDEAWSEGRAKSGGILMAAIGFQFVMFAAGMVGSLISGFLGTALSAVAAFFLIYTIPAAAIGGLPGPMALSASVRAVRANPAGSIVLAVVFLGLFVFVPIGLQYALGAHLTPTLYALVMALVQAIVLAYLAFPFAKQYDDVAFRGFW
ncbi:MAG: hypothetical protein JO199_11735 [Candidatus Eremiobacteraeota bacterium]|nr:hypothetical protein [Candidatus Eremiobacteraeota bacterium]